MAAVSAQESILTVAAPCDVRNRARREASCNPDENPVECWHWCFWDALIRTPGGWEARRRALMALSALLSHFRACKCCVRACAGSG